MRVIYKFKRSRCNIALWPVFPRSIALLGCAVLSERNKAASRLVRALDASRSSTHVSFIRRRPRLGAPITRLKNAAPQRQTSTTQSNEEENRVERKAPDPLMSSRAFNNAFSASSSRQRERERERGKSTNVCRGPFDKPINYFMII